MPFEWPASAIIPQQACRILVARAALLSLMILTILPLNASLTKVGRFFRPLTNPYRRFVSDPNFHCLIVLGTFPAPPSTQSSDRDPASGAQAGAQTNSSDESTDVVRLPAILRVERTAFPSTFSDHLSTGVVTSMKRIGDTDIVRPSGQSRILAMLTRPGHLNVLHSIRGGMRGWLARTTSQT